MQYIKVRWLHSSADDPILLYSEVDAERWEVRKVEIFPDGRRGFACADESALDTRLGIQPMPTLSEIAADPQFQPVEVSKEEFEEIWSGRTRSG